MSPAPDWLATLEASCVSIEQVVTPGILGVGVPGCPGLDVAQVLRHLGEVHRLVYRWVTDAHRPAAAQPMPGGTDPRAWFAAGWRPLHEMLAAGDPGAEASTWCTYHPTLAFWWRRMAHESAIHAADVLDAAGRRWDVTDDFAHDGVDEALRLWLGTQLGSQVGGTGQVVRLVAGERFWTVALNDHNVEVNHLDVPAQATVRGAPGGLYRWAWGRAGDQDVAVHGERPAVTALRGALARAMQ